MNRTGNVFTNDRFLEVTALHLTNPAHGIFFSLTVEHIDQAVAVEVHHVNIGHERTVKGARRSANGFRSVFEF